MDVVIFDECIYKHQIVEYCKQNGYLIEVVSVPLQPKENVSIRYTNIKIFHKDRNRILYEIDSSIAPIRIIADGLTFISKDQKTKEKIVFYTRDRLVGRFI